MFEPIEFDLVQKPQKLTQLAFWKTFFIKPNNIGLRKVNQGLSFVFSKGHFPIGYFNEAFVVKHREILDGKCGKV